MSDFGVNSQKVELINRKDGDTLETTEVIMRIHRGVVSQAMPSICFVSYEDSKVAAIKDEEGRGEVGNLKKTHIFLFSPSSEANPNLLSTSPGWALGCELSFGCCPESPPSSFEVDIIIPISQMRKTEAQRNGVISLRCRYRCNE